MRLVVLSLLLTLPLSACRTKDDTAADTATTVDSVARVDSTDSGDTGLDPLDDVDQDGFPRDLDCDDEDPAVNPAATETCNGIDDDCDGLIDDEDDAVEGTGPFYRDADEDGFGDPEQTVSACEAPEGYVDEATDCDDGNAGVHPEATEVCNGLDDDCDGLRDDEDDEVGGTTTFWIDTDGDGVGTTAHSTEACEAPEGFATASDDCDDGDATVFPDAPELCDGQDNDCDTEVDEEADGTSTWFTDADGDGYGDPDSPVDSCDGSGGLSAEGTDCDDTDRAVNPSATEVCDGVDNDCSGDADGSDAADATTWYADSDGDGFGDASSSTLACEQPAQHVEDDSDCEDGDAAVNPDASETCNDSDDDCDGLTDDDDPGLSGASTWYLDHDGDGYGDAAHGVEACEAPSSHVSDDQDCDDLDAAVHPGATEDCDGIDGDCDGDIDEDLPTTTWYDDDDGDGYGDPDAVTESCEQPTGTVTVGEDCDDTDASIQPLATEVCDGVDNDCDGDTDEESAADVQTWYSDADGDGYGDADAATESCEAPTDHVSDATDCDDTDSAVNPGAAEVCNGQDDDCNGWTDDEDPGISDADTWHLDYDADGYGGTTVTVTACDQPSGYVADADDCDDLDSDVNPGGTETCNDVDDDCDGLIDADDTDLVDAVGTWYADTDMDGYGDPDAAVEDCEQPSGTVENSDDCDDTDALVSPDATEICNGIDDDCDGSADGGTAGSADCPGTSCLDVLTEDPTASTGVFWLEPEAGQLFEAWCDMDTDGGGWTLAFIKNSVDQDTYEDFASDYEDLGDLADSPENASASSSAIGGWLDLNAFDFSVLRIGSYWSGAETWLSADIQRTELRLDFGQYGYFLYGDSNGYYWCAGDHAYTDSGSGQENQPSGAPSDCKGHGSLGAGWDFSTVDTTNQGLTLCGNDYSRWMHYEYGGGSVSYPTQGAAQAIWVR